MSVGSGFTRELVESLARQHDEPDWMRQRRLAAFAAWLAAPRPNAEDEDWRRTDLDAVDLAQVAALVSPNGTTGGLPEEEPGAGGWLAVRDGAIAARRLNPEYARQGVLFCSLQDALRKHPEIVERAFMTTAVPADEHAFTRLHAALWTDGVLVYVPRGVQVAQPLVYSSQLTRDGVSVFHHTLVVVEDDAAVDCIEEFTGGGNTPTLSAPVTELLVGRGAKVRWAGVHAWSAAVHEFATRRAHLAADAEVSLTDLTLGAKQTKSFVGATLAGAGANCHLYGAYFPEAGQRFDYTTLQDHQVPHCTSDLLFKGALYDQAQAAFRGVVRVHPAAQQTDAYQTNNNLLLGPEARADSMPVLEIEADDVKCSHGATLAHLKEEDLFYLRSRGLNRDAARQMVIAGFFGPVIDTLPLRSARERWQQVVARRIADH